MTRSASLAGVAVFAATPLLAQHGHQAPPSSGARPGHEEHLPLRRP